MLDEFKDQQTLQISIKQQLMVKVQQVERLQVKCQELLEQLRAPSLNEDQDPTPKEINQQISMLQKALDLFADTARLGIRTDQITKYFTPVSQMADWFQKAHQLIAHYESNIDPVGQALKPITLQH